MDRSERTARPSGDRGNVNDRSGLALHHRSCYGTATQKSGFEIQIDHLIPTLFGQIENSQPLYQRSGVVYQNVDGTKFINRTFNEGLNLARFGNVSLNGYGGGAAGSNYFRAGCFGAIFVAVKVDRDSRTIRGEGFRSGPPDSRGCTSD